jgi:thiol-disulfide isomerase/thioredoxin
MVMKRFFKTLLVLVLILMPITFASAKKTTTTTAAAQPTGKVTMYVFYGNGCPHCEELEEYIATTLKKDSRVKDYLEVKYYETWYDETNQQVLTTIGSALGVDIKGVPFVLIGDDYFSGYGSQMNEEIVSKIQAQKDNSKYVDVVAAVTAQTKVYPNESNPEAGIDAGDSEKDDSKKNDVIGIVILGVTVVIILAIIFTKHSDDAEEDEADEKEDTEDEVDEEEVEESEEKEEKTVKKTTSTKKKANKKKSAK